ncbi:MAG: hypothetical protein Q4G24_15365 [Paracoccus sp. (in: a-proteobacteria)]|uniref:hypothetical protein n=1 Tax=Paracoccus sp. TaxID=267 RepID=UPI0026E028AF|nr:hypothetical protein [Paracoccus sp. (in: a-proteobacteria)]MDO5622827.1 hypothetical protein [Paracoccus sp. (in: a-proteobacteria)]
MRRPLRSYPLLVPAFGLWAGLAQADGGLVISAIPLEELSTQSTVIAPVSAAPGTSGLALMAAAPRADLPRPSVILGDLAVLMTMAERGPLGVPFPQREAIRARDAGMFDRLLMQGAFDPDPPRVGAAIQTELARMNCYSGGIDGDWGRGSVTALTRYVDAGGAAQAGSAPDLALFRAVARGSDVTCPEQRVVAPVAPAVSRSGGTTSRNPAASTRQTEAARRTAPAAASTTAPEQAPAQQGSSRGIGRGLMGAGVFR